MTTGRDASSGGGLIPQEFIQKILDVADIFTFAADKLSLKKASGPRYKALCPFHNEKTPSFYIHQDKQYYHCYGCGANGNIISLMMHLNRTTFPETIEALAKQYHLQMPARSDNDPNHQFVIHGKRLAQKAQQLFVSQRQSHQEVTDYLLRRGLRAETLEKYAIGYAPARFPSQFFSNADLSIARTIGLIYENASSHDLSCYFRKRVMFPIHNPKGDVIGFGGRTLLDQQPKYLNSKESALFHKSNILYGLYQARQTTFDYLIVVEGYMDVLMLSNHGIHNAVATLGTAVTAQHLRQMLKYTQKIAFCFDGDQAGQKAAWKALNQALPLLVDGIELKFIFMPPGEDPDSFIQQHGRHKFKEAFANGLSMADYFFQELASQFPTHNLEKKAIFGKKALLMIEQMQNSMLKQLLMQRLEEKLACTITPASHHPNAPQKSQPSHKRRSPFEMAIRLMIQNPHYLDKKWIPTILLEQSFDLCKMLQHMLELSVNFGCKSTAALLEACKSGPYYDHILTLALDDVNIPSNMLEIALVKLMNEAELKLIEKQINAILQPQANHGMLDQEVKKQLQEKLARKAKLNRFLSEQH